MRNDIMYIELRGESRMIGSGRIGRVTVSKTHKTIYYQGRTLKRLGHGGGKVNYVDADTGECFWVSGCKKAGNDTLYPGVIEIDEDAREEYWLSIRNQPDRVSQTTVRSQGKHNKRQPK